MERFDFVIPSATAAADQPNADASPHAVLAAAQVRRGGAALVRSSAVLATLMSIGFISALLQTQHAPAPTAAVADAAPATLTASDEGEPARAPMYQGEPAVY